MLQVQLGIANVFVHDVDAEKLHIHPDLWGQMQFSGKFHTLLLIGP